jgi:hypothetical protein
MARQIFGAFLILLGVAGIMLAVMGARSAQQTVNGLGESVEISLDLVIDSLDTVLDSLLLTQDALADVEAAMTRVEGTAVNVSTALESTDPIIDEMRLITTQDLPNSIEAIEQAVPDAVQAADAIDTTLTTLNRFEINTSILGFPIQYDLGINYDPAVPFSVSVQEIGTSLDGLPERLRGLEQDFSDTQSNLQIISQDMDDLSGDLTAINQQIAGITPLVNDFIRIVTDGADNLRLIKGQINDQVATVNTIITLGMVWLVLSQVVPLYLGYELIMGRLSPGDEPILTVENADEQETAVTDDENV